MTLVQDKPTVANNVATYKHWINDMATGELDKAPFAEDAETSDPSGKYKGKAQILQSFKVWKTAFPKATGEITNQIAMGDQVVSEVLFKSTHTGPLASPTGIIAPTNKPIQFKVMNITSFRNGLIQRERSYYDQADLMLQLGVPVLPKP